MCLQMVTARRCFVKWEGHPGGVVGSVVVVVAGSVADVVVVMAGPGDVSLTDVAVVSVVDGSELVVVSPVVAVVVAGSVVRSVIVANGFVVAGWDVFALLDSVIISCLSHWSRSH